MAENNKDNIERSILYDRSLVLHAEQDLRRTALECAADSFINMRVNDTKVAEVIESIRKSKLTDLTLVLTKFFGYENQFPFITDQDIQRYGITFKEITDGPGAPYDELTITNPNAETPSIGDIGSMTGIVEAYFKAGVFSRGVVVSSQNNRQDNYSKTSKQQGLRDRLTSVKGTYYYDITFCSEQPPTELIKSEIYHATWMIGETGPFICSLFNFCVFGGMYPLETDEGIAKFQQKRATELETWQLKVPDYGSLSKKYLDPFTGVEGTTRKTLVDYGGELTAHLKRENIL